MKVYTSESALSLTLIRTENSFVYFFRTTRYSHWIGFEEETKAYMFLPSVIDALILVMGKTPV